MTSVVAMNAILEKVGYECYRLITVITAYHLSMLLADRLKRQGLSLYGNLRLARRASQRQLQDRWRDREETVPCHTAAAR